MKDRETLGDLIGRLKGARDTFLLAVRYLYNHVPGSRRQEDEAIVRPETGRKRVESNAVRC